MAWENVSYHPLEVKSRKIDRLLSTLRNVYVNGGAIFASFEADDFTAFDQAAARSQNDKNRRYIAFLESPSVAEALPELQVIAPLDPKPEFQHTVPLAAEGSLTHWMLCGGAYERFRGSMRQARKISHDFMNEVAAGQWLQLPVATSCTPWTKWFHDVAWDKTLIVCDRQARRFSLLCVTDTD